MNQTRGFTLIELAIVLVIITILIGGLAMPLSAQIQARRIAETQKILEEAREAIIGYAIAHRVIGQECECHYQTDDPYELNSSTTCDVSLCPLQSANTPLTLNARHYLPCPDTDFDGIENRGLPSDIHACQSASGLFPWATLGTARQDAWGNRLHYRVTAEHSDRMIGFSTDSVGDNQICPSATGTCVPGTLAPNVPVVLLSYGPNSRGARNVNLPQGAPTPDAPSDTGDDELENLNGTARFVSRAPTNSGDTGGAFDDLVVWISNDLLSTRGCPNHECYPRQPPP